MCVCAYFNELKRSHSDTNIFKSKKPSNNCNKEKVSKVKPKEKKLYNKNNNNK